MGVHGGSAAPDGEAAPPAPVVRARSQGRRTGWAWDGAQCLHLEGQAEQRTGARATGGQVSGRRVRKT